MGRKSHVQVLAFLMFALLLAPTSWGDDGQTSSAETERSNDGRCHRVKGGEGDEQQSGGGCSDGIPRISNMVEWEEHVRSSKFSVVGFFGDTASAEKGDFEAVFSQGKHRMAIVEQSPRSWLGTRALPDWLGIDCSHDSSTYAVATYHSDAQGRLPNRDVDALFGGSRARRGKMPKISFFIHTRSSPLLGIAASVEESLLEASGRCLIAIVHEGEGAAGSKERAARGALEKVSRKFRDVAMCVRMDRTLLSPRDEMLLKEESGDGYVMALLKHGIEGILQIPAPHTAQHLEEWIAGKCRP